ncbi:MAG: heavy metal translocating P-type ATPase metal-binding domain-containing protein [Myxococcales bacterium]|nr:heavy metal translocating P-type ATPase metal-binding domain-containing protein [Myxococcales bacterium]
MTASVPCAHCGLPAPASEPGPSFCCAGCRAVHHLLHDAGLGDYYALRSSLEVEPPQQPADEALDALRARYAHLDDPQVLQAHGLAPGEATLELTGLHCAACVWVLERLPRLHPGVSAARVDYGRGQIHLRWDPSRVSLAALAVSLHRLGYPPRLRTEQADAERRREARRELLRLAVTGALAGNVMLMAFVTYAGVMTSHGELGRFMEGLSLALAVPAVTWGAWPFYRGAGAGLRAGVLHMDLPISLGIAAGFGASVVATLTGTGEPYYDSVTALVFLLLVGRYVQQRGQQRVATRGELWQGLVPGMATRQAGGAWARVYTSALGPGDRVRVEPGECFAADGRVVEGRGHVDLSMLTGESRPEPVGPGSPVWAGTRNTGAAIELEVEAVGPATRLGRVVERLGAADAERAPVVRMADRLAGWFVATVLGLAFLMAAIGKSAQVPVTGYVLRAMEGPTTSSALFYGTLSIHAGVYLILRVEPLIANAPVARIAVVTVGLLTAITASMSARVRPDAKGSLALATAGQAGLMLAEAGMGWTQLAMWHLLAHGLLRLAQFLRTPSWLEDAHARRSALGGGSFRSPFHAERILPAPLRDFLYAAALSRFGLDALIDRLFSRPLAALAHLVSSTRPRIRERNGARIAEVEFPLHASGGSPPLPTTRSQGQGAR